MVLDDYVVGQNHEPSTIPSVTEQMRDDYDKLAQNVKQQTGRIGFG